MEVLQLYLNLGLFNNFWYSNNSPVSILMNMWIFSHYLAFTCSAMLESRVEGSGVLVIPYLHFTHSAMLVLAWPTVSIGCVGADVDLTINGAGMVSHSGDRVGTWCSIFQGSRGTLGSGS